MQQLIRALGHGQVFEMDLRAIPLLLNVILAAVLMIAKSSAFAAEPFSMEIWQSSSFALDEKDII